MSAQEQPDALHEAMEHAPLLLAQGQSFEAIEAVARAKFPNDPMCAHRESLRIRNNTRVFGNAYALEQLQTLSGVSS
jgi:hypothetical protein